VFVCVTCFSVTPPVHNAQVTTDSIKFKAKSWIDVFGGPIHTVYSHHMEGPNYTSPSHCVGDDRLNQIQGQILDRRFWWACLQGTRLGGDQHLQEAGGQPDVLRLAGVRLHRAGADFSHVGAGEGLRETFFYWGTHRAGVL